MEMPKGKKRKEKIIMWLCCNLKGKQFKMDTTISYKTSLQLLIFNILYNFDEITVYF